MVMRGLEAYNRRDVEALIAIAHPEIEWHPALMVKLGGGEAVYRGHAGVRELMAEVEDTLAELHVDLPEIRDLGERVLAVGRIRARGKTSGAVTEAPLGYLADFRDGMVIRIRTYLDHNEALEAAGLSE